MYHHIICALDIFKFALVFSLLTMILKSIALMIFQNGVDKLMIERSKSIEKRSKDTLNSAYTTMRIACIIGLGLGDDFILSNYLLDF